MSECIQSLLKKAVELFSDVSGSPRLDAEVLLAHVLGKPRSYLFTWPDQCPESYQVHQFNNLIELRIKPTPIAYLTGEKEFYSLMFRTNPETLIPRPETELLVDRALEICRINDFVNVLDLGTGTGAISIALKKNNSVLQLVASDINRAAIDLAALNADIHQVSIDWVESNWFDAIDIGMQFDLIVSNPPYIAKDDAWLKRGDLPAEPITALSPGDSGLESYEIILTDIDSYLRAGGYVLFEHGYDQSSAIENLLSSYGFVGIQCHCDDNDLPRLTEAHR